MSDATALGQVFGELIGAAVFTLVAVQVVVFVGVGLWYAEVCWRAAERERSASDGEQR